MSARPAIRIDKGVVLPSGAEPLAALSKPSALVTSSGGKSITTSLMVAEKFGKAHKNVLRAIDKLECSPEFRRLNFAPAEYVDDQGKPRPMFSITRDGFSLLAMGFTGREAMQWKERYIAAFSAMDLELRRIATNKASIEWQEARAIGKADHTELTDAVKALCERAHARGDSATPQHLWHISAAKTITRALFVIEFGEKVAGVRDRLTRRQLLRLADAELVYADTITALLATDLHHRQINELAKQTVEDQVRASGGQQVPGIDRRRPLLLPAVMGALQ